MPPRPSEERSQYPSTKKNERTGHSPEHHDEKRRGYQQPEDRCTKTEHKSSCRNSLEDVHSFLSPTPEPSGSIQSEHGENEMPGIEESQKQENVPHFDPHRDEGGDETECGQMPSWDCR